MKEQIEELWNIITTDCDGKCVGCEFENDDWCFTHHAARAIYNAGYRKIIRCKDCKCCEHCYPAKAVGRVAEEGWYCIFHKWYVKPDGFCSFAKMKGGAE